MLPLVPGDLLDEPCRAVDAGVVDEHVDPREALEGVDDQALDGRRMRDVGLGGRDGAGVGRDSHELFPSAVEVGDVARAHEHLRAGCEVRARDLEAEAVAAPGDDRGSSREDLGHPVRLPTRT